MRVLDNLENYDIPSGFHLTAEQEEQLAADLKEIVLALIPLRSSKLKTRQYFNSHLRYTSNVKYAQSRPDTIKKVAIDLLAKIKEKISEMDHWTDKQETRAVINILIRDTLWSELPASYDEASVDHYRQEIYEYVYTRYRYVA